MGRESLAWAAGFYDGEGSSSMYIPRQRRTARRQIQVSQSGRGGIVPPALVQFREIVGEGNVTGPYRDSLYYWKTTRMETIDAVARGLWPYLGAGKREQFVSMTERARRALPKLPADVRTIRTERAWAAGFFDGEGSLWIARTPCAQKWRGLALELPQSSEAGVPDTLRRFLAIVGAGSISGPRRQRNRWSRLPQYRWQLTGRYQVSAVIRCLWPFLATVNRGRVLAVRDLLDPELASSVTLDN